MNDVQHEGQWWLPRSPANTQAGTLTLSPGEQPKLSLLGTLGGSHEPLNEFGSYPMLHGITTNNRFFSLVECNVVGKTLGSPYGTRMRIEARAALEGVLASTRSLSLRQATLELDAVGEWFGSGTVTPTLATPGSETNYRYEPRAPLTIPLDGSAVITISNGLEQSMRPGYLELRETPQLSVQLARATSMWRFQERYLRPLRYFFGLAADRSVRIDGWTISSPRLTGVMLDGSRREVPVPIHAALRGAALDEHPRPGAFLFTLDDVRDEIEVMLPRWMSITRKLGVVCDLHFAILDSPHAFMEWRFLNSVHALETYHRRSYPDDRQPEDLHGARMEAILSSAPSEHKAWLKEQLRYSNENTLRERLRNLLQRVGDIVDEVVGNRQRFVGRVVDARNDLTHNANADAGDRNLGETLYWLQQRCSYVLQACLLTDIGISNSQCRGFFLRNRRYHFVASKVAGRTG